MGKFGVKEISPISDVQAAIGAGAMLAFFVFWALIAAVGDDFLKLIGGKDNLSGWVQAIGSIAAIIAAALGTRWQINKSNSLQEHADLKSKIQMSEVCLEMCNAIFSIMEEKESAGKKKLMFKVLGSHSSAMDAVVFKSTERVVDLQEVMRYLVAKNMPVELLRSLFGLQKILAQYKDFLTHMEAVPPSYGLLSTLNSPDAFARNRHREVRKEVNRIIKNIVEYKDSLSLKLK